MITQVNKDRLLKQAINSKVPSLTRPQKKVPEHCF